MQMVFLDNLQNLEKNGCGEAEEEGKDAELPWEAFTFDQTK